MSVWVLQLSLPEVEEAKIEERTVLPLPWAASIDFTGLANRGDALLSLRAFYAEDPPETLQRRVDAIWPVLSALGREDTVAVVLMNTRQVVLAEVVVPYRYAGQNDGAGSEHSMQVRWLGVRLKLSALRAHQAALLALPALRELNDSQARQALLGRLPRPYNRFARWRWLPWLFMALGLLQLLRR